MVRRLALVTLLAWLATPGTSVAQKRYGADRFDVDMALARDGSMRVTETVIFRFESGSFTEVFRSIPTRRTDGITDLAGTIDGQAWPAPGGQGRFRVERQDGLKAVWRFPETAGATKTFGLTYTARGVVERQQESDVLTWYVLPSNHKYRIGESRVRLDWPPGAQPIGSPLVTPSGAEIETTDRGLIVTARDLAPDADFRVTARFAPGSVADTMPEWQARGVRGRAIAPTVFAIAAVILASGLTWLLVFWIGHRRVPLSGVNPLASSTPPDTLPPALAATLASPMSGVTAYGFFGALLDLARRGAVRIDETPGRNWMRSRAFEVLPGERPADLRPHEQVLLDLLFAPKRGPRDRVRFDEILKSIRSGWKRFRTAVVHELVEDGLLSQERQRTRGRIIAVGVGLSVLGGVGFIPAGILTNTYSGWPLIVPAAVALLGFVVLIIGACFSTLSEEGRRAGAGWLAYSRHLKAIARQQSAMPDASAFEQSLAFATAAGFGSAWVKGFRKSGKLTAVPGWFKAATAADAARQVDAFIVMMGGVHAAGHSGAAGAASAGGGGASGAH